MTPSERLKKLEILDRTPKPDNVYFHPKMAAYFRKRTGKTTDNDPQRPETPENESSYTGNIHERGSANQSSHSRVEKSKALEEDPKDPSSKAAIASATTGQEETPRAGPGISPATVAALLNEIGIRSEVGPENIVKRITTYGVDLSSFVSCARSARAKAFKRSR